MYETNEYGTYEAYKGNDGDKSNCNPFSSPHSLVHSYAELTPWYGVDLGVALHVAGVNLTNRADEPGKSSAVSCYWAYSSSNSSNSKFSLSAHNLMAMPSQFTRFYDVCS